MNLDKLNASEIFQLACDSHSKGQDKNTVTFFEKASQMGHALASSNLGIFYYFGDCGVKQDFNTSHFYFKKAMKAEDPTAYYYLARMYLYGEGVQADAVRALEYYTKAAMGGLPEAQCELGDLYIVGADFGVDQNFRLAIHWLAYAAEQGFSRAIDNFNALYYEGAESSGKPTGFWFEREKIENRKIPCTEPFKVLISEGEYVVDIQRSH